MESRFGHDFSRVRIHSDVQTSESTDALNAEAYTVGNHITFRSGRYAPETGGGIRLLAHELIHTLQQYGNAPPADEKLETSDPAGTEEKEAESAANSIAEEKPVTYTQGGSYKIARQVAGAGSQPITTEVREAIISDWMLKNKDQIRRWMTPLIDHLQDEASRDEPHLWSFEARTEKGIINEIFPEEESVEERRARLEELADDLLSLSIKLRNEPIPPAWLRAEVSESTSIDINPDLAGAASRLYLHYAVKAGRNITTAHKNVQYILTVENVPKEKKEAECPPQSTGIDILVNDPKNDPDNYIYPVSLTTWEEGGPQRVKQVYKDVCGIGAIAGVPFFYYRFEENGERWYLDAENEEEVTGGGTPSWHTRLRAPPHKPLSP